MTPNLISNSIVHKGSTPRTRRRNRRRRTIFASALIGCIAIGCALAACTGSNTSDPPAPQQTPYLITLEPAEEKIDTPESAAPAATPEPDSPTEEAIALARLVWGEARGCSETQQAAVVWCVLNRVDSGKFPNDILGVITQKSQFYGYDPGNPVDPEILTIVQDVLHRWETGGEGRVLPTEYLFFYGDGKENHYRTQWDGGQHWDWSLESPYE